MMRQDFEFEGVRGRVRFDESMSQHTSWKVGGPARYFFEPQDEADLGVFLQQLDVALPVLWLGLGSNLLIRDAGFNGVVIAAHRGLRQLWMADATQIFAEAGVSCARLARFAGQHGVVGAEFMTGIPGTIGGALAMNAGAFGAETWNWVQRVRLIDRRGDVREEDATAFEISYRSVRIPAEQWFTAAYFSFSPRSDAHPGADVRSLLEKRSQTQPIGQSSAGSVFKNPPGDYAARLIEEAGLKGKRHGGACVSDQHANFIVNDRSATAKDIEDLIELIRDEVERRFGVLLDPEVRFVGERS